MTFAEYRRLAAQLPGIAELLSQPAGIEDVEFEAPINRDVAQPGRFD